MKVSRKIIAELVRLAVEKDYASDYVEFDLDGNWEPLKAEFKEIFGEDLFPDYEEEV